MTGKIYNCHLLQLFIKNQRKLVGFIRRKCEYTGLYECTIKHLLPCVFVSMRVYALATSSLNSKSNSKSTSGFCLPIFLMMSDMCEL